MNRPHKNRRSIRLKGYDYSRAGIYFVTILTQNHECLFGDIVNGKMVLNEYGNIVADEWMKTAVIRHEIKLDEWVVMPNHFHGIVWICRNNTGDRRDECRGDRRDECRGDQRDECRGDRLVAPTGPAPRSLGALVAGFKSAVTKRINETHNTPGTKLWQRNYYEHIVRNENELNRIRQYIQENPDKWDFGRKNIPGNRLPNL